MVGEILQDQHFGDGIGLGAAEGFTKLEPEHAAVAQGLHGLGRQRALLFAARTGLAQRAGDLVDRGEQHLALFVGIAGKLVDHGVSVPDYSRPIGLFHCSTAMMKSQLPQRLRWDGGNSLGRLNTVYPIIGYQSIA